ncbi:hypothetical protein [Leptolyngbya sp. FACHB-16]|uniref:hypothetical protein n=1 Tax=unclassified Leptolyngbya TaxID=2650499 RepID=UPI0016868439|nr:hypothetical protein [Leptolyngbya sp. FACHB-16]MBD2158881.1 hypothetical protein [Leptolyngbya sp. FACHB-16]
MSIEIYPSQNRSAISMLCRINESDEGTIIEINPESRQLTAEKARFQASILLKAAAIIDNWPAYQRMIMMRIGAHST